MSEFNKTKIVEELPLANNRVTGINTKPTLTRKSKTIKIVLAGAGGVGKTTLVRTYKTGKFVETLMTIAVEFHTDNYRYGGQEFPLQIWDLGGQRQFLNMGVFKKYCHGAQAAMVCFDLSDPETLAEVPLWMEVLPTTIPIILVGTKAELYQDDESGLLKSVVKLVDRYQFIHYLPISAKINPHSFEWLINGLLAEIIRKEPL
jgi:small GTP-binding protein